MVDDPQIARIAARLRLLAAEEGGRSEPIRANYRPRFYMGDESSDMAIDTIAGSGEMNPGDEADVTAFLLSPEKFAEKLAADGEFELKEGSRTVATGIITDVTLETRPLADRLG